jgi:hypothetical protein
VIAVRTLKRAQVVIRARGHDARQRHFSLAFGAGRSLNGCKIRRHSWCGHDVHLEAGGSTTLSVTGRCRDAAVMHAPLSFAPRQAVQY